MPASVHQPGSPVFNAGPYAAYNRCGQCLRAVYLPAGSYFPVRPGVWCYRALGRVKGDC